MSIRIVRVSMGSGASSEELRLGRNATEIIGERNTGKTTWLRVVDYCLGGSDAVGAAVGSDVAARHDVFTLHLELAGRAHQVERRPSQYGFASKVFVDGQDMPSRAVSGWLLSELGWPANVQIPKALRAGNATELTPLTMRNLLRHLYRREDSWSDFASKEWEYHRRAVLRFFLGALDIEGEINEFNLAMADAEVSKLRARVQDSALAADETLRSVVAPLGLEISGWADIQGAEQLLAARLELLEEERAAIERDVRNADGYQAVLNDDYAAAARLVAAAGEEVAGLEAALVAYQEGAATVRGEISRFDRATNAISVFDSVPVRLCPACGQEVSDNHQHPDECFLCSQPVTDDLRQRRILIEQRALADELTELELQIQRTQMDLERAFTGRSESESTRASVAARISDERVSLIAPHVARLEGLSAESAEVRQTIATIGGLRIVHERVVGLRKELATAQDRRDRLVSQQLERDKQIEAVVARCDRFAGDMNLFLGRLQALPWTFGLVELRHETVEFYIDGLPWRERLGGESKVVFLIAYHFALLRLSAYDDPAVRAPGLAILDNPIQQAVPDVVVAEAMRLLEREAVASDTQVIATLARPLSTGVPGTRVDVLHQQYGSGRLEPDPGSENPDVNET